MSDQIDDGGPAYPVQTARNVGDIGLVESTPGMSLRDAFALHLAPAVFTALKQEADKDDADTDSAESDEDENEDDDGLDGFPAMVAILSYSLADAMLFIRGKNLRSSKKGADQ